MAAIVEPPARSAAPSPPLAGYIVAVVVTVVAILSQYFVPQMIPWTRDAYGSLLGSFLIVYGIPIATFALLVGFAPLRGAFANMPFATIEGLRWYGIYSLVALAVLVGLVAAYTALDPGALKLLDQPNPVIQTAASDPWFFIGLSFVIGAIEETIFRGWIFGFWLDRPGASWGVAAVWTSALFAGVHLYYSTTYGPAAPLIFPTLFFLGLAFSTAMRYSKGNLVVIALLHGAYDATSFGSILNMGAADAVHYLLILVGVLVAVILYLRSQPERTPPTPFGGSSGPSGGLPWSAFPPPPHEEGSLPPGANGSAREGWVEDPSNVERSP